MVLIWPHIKLINTRLLVGICWVGLLLGLSACGSGADDVQTVTTQANANQADQVDTSQPDTTESSSTPASSNAAIGNAQVLQPTHSYLCLAHAMAPAIYKSLSAYKK